MMRRILLLMIAAFLLLMNGCASEEIQITREEVIAAYESAGYAVSSGTYEDLPSSAVAYVQADRADGDYIHFMFFSNEEDALAYEKEMDHPVVKGFFSILFGEPIWERMKTCGCIVVTYSNPNDFTPFQTLLKSK